MSTKTVFDLTPAEKLQLIEDLWEDLSLNPEDVPVHDWQIEAADRRRENLQKHPASAVSWADVKARIRARHGR